MQLDPEEIDDFIERALDEDIGRGDLTTNVTIPEDVVFSASMVAREEIVVCGIVSSAGVEPSSRTVSDRSGVRSVWSRRRHRPARLSSSRHSREERSMTDPGFWWEFASKVGAPTFAATLVSCLLSGEFALLHGVLLASGLGLMGLSHWRTHHRVRPAP